MIIIKFLRVHMKDISLVDFVGVTQLYTMGYHLIVVYEETPLVYKTAKFPINSLARMEVEF